MKTNKIFIVTTEADAEGRTVTTLGYAVGRPKYIKEYFNDKKAYRISLREVDLIYIDENSVRDRQLLIKEKNQIEDRLKLINSLL